MSDDWNRNGNEGDQSAPPMELPFSLEGDASSSLQIPGNQPERIQLIGAIAAGVAHEFNNLLTIALGSLEQLRRQTLDDRGQEQLERLDWSVRQAGRLARQVLSFVRRDSGPPSLWM